MDKNQIINQLEKNHQRFVQFFTEMNDADFTHTPSEKWMIGQHLVHIEMSVSAVNIVFVLPNFLVKWKFGKANRPSKTYNELVEKYHFKLALGGRAPTPFEPQKVSPSDKTSLLRKLEKAVAKMSKGIAKMSENDLDTLILPHPLLGRLTLREMIYFTSYHVEHHEKLVEQYLKK